jgi:uncharacterized membrane protein
LIDRDKLQEAIKRAELRTSGEIRISLSTFFLGSVRKTAERAFARLKMDQTKDRNGVLFFVVPSRRRFVVLGDQGIHEKAGQEFWDRLAAILSEKFRGREFTEGLGLAVREAGEMLAVHFPYSPGVDKNELPDEIDLNTKP